MCGYQHSPTFATFQHIKMDVLIFSLLSIIISVWFCERVERRLNMTESTTDRELSAFVKSNMTSNIGVNFMTSKRYQSDANVV